MLQAFTASKQALADATYLAHPLPGAGLSLAFDALVTHVGVGLHQCHQESTTWEPLFFSKKLEPAQTRYSAFDRELLACVTSIRPFHYMLEGWRYALLTDHKPLTFAIGQISEAWTTTQASHLSFIAEYTSDIRHISGVSNVVADTMSRPPPTAAAVSLFTKPAGPALAATDVKVPYGLLVAALSADTGPFSSTAPASVAADVKGPSGLSAAALSAGIGVSLSSPSLVAVVQATAGAELDWTTIDESRLSCPETAGLQFRALPLEDLPGG
jgi:hypothetical protein